MDLMILLSEKIARVLFGDTDPVGKTVLFNNTELLTVWFKKNTGCYTIWTGDYFSYANHVKLNPAYFLITIAIIILISALTLVFHTVKAASLNPADTLRNE